jgi:hypothetical protein
MKIEESTLKLSSKNTRHGGGSDTQKRALHRRRAFLMTFSTAKEGFPYGKKEAIDMTVW